MKGDKGSPNREDSRTTSSGGNSSLRRFCPISFILIIGAFEKGEGVSAQSHWSQDEYFGNPGVGYRGERTLEKGRRGSVPKPGSIRKLEIFSYFKQTEVEMGSPTVQPTRGHPKGSTCHEGQQGLGPAKDCTSRTRTRDRRSPGSRSFRQPEGVQGGVSGGDVRKRTPEPGAELHFLDQQKILGHEKRSCVIQTARRRRTA